LKARKLEVPLKEAEVGYSSLLAFKV